MFSCAGRTVLLGGAILRDPVLLDVVVIVAANVPLQIGILMGVKKNARVRLAVRGSRRREFWGAQALSTFVP
jgi:hypothetical protein